MPYKNSKGKIFYGMHFYPGVAEYQEPGGEPYRVFYAFDPRRTGILLIGGCKTGADRFYEQMVPLADDLYDIYLAELRKEGLL